MLDKSVVDELIENLVETPVYTNILLPNQQFVDENVSYFLTKCNGGYSKDGYFHFFGNSGNSEHSIVHWNENELWKYRYETLVLDYYFFAEDVFGNQFGFKINHIEDGIYQFWVDDGRIELFADDFEQFVDFTVFDFDIFGKMRDLTKAFYESVSQGTTVSKHLSYKKPILLGGDSGDVKNLEFSNPISHLRFLGQIVTQCRKLEKGTQIVDVLIDAVSETITLIYK